MLRSRLLGALLTFLVLGFAPSETALARHHNHTHYAQLETPASSNAVAGPRATAPYGWVEFCRRYVGECDTQPLPTASVAMTSRVWRQIEKINRSVNDAITPVSDMEHWGVLDQWDYPTDGKGDCEDYALMKRKMLIDAGLPRQALLMTVVRDLHDDGHAVLTLVSDHGDYVLDNLVMAVRPWNTTGYRFLKRQSQEDPNVWLSLRSDDVPAVAATHALPDAH